MISDTPENVGIEFIKDSFAKKSSIYHSKSKQKYAKTPSSNGYEKKCGPVKTIQLGKPLRFDDYKAMSEKTRREYIEWIFDYYPKLDTYSIATMLGCSQRTLKLDLGVIGVQPPNISGAITEDSKKRFKKDMIDPLVNGTVEKNPEVASTPVTQQNSKTQKFAKYKTVEVTDDLLAKIDALAPVTFEEFLSCSIDKQKYYLEGIMNKYPGVKIRTIALMFATPERSFCGMYKKIMSITKAVGISAGFKSVNGYANDLQNKERFYRDYGINVEDINKDSKPAASVPVEKVEIPTFMDAFKQQHATLSDFTPAISKFDSIELPSAEEIIEPVSAPVQEEVTEVPETANVSDPDPIEEEKVKYKSFMDCVYESMKKNNELADKAIKVLNNFDAVVDASKVQQIIDGLGITGKIRLIFQQVP